MSQVTASSSVRRRRVLSAVTLTVLLCLLLAGAWIGYRSLFASAEDRQPQAQKQCRSGVHKGDTVRTRDVTVSVFNAGTRSGLADKVQGSLVTRGFLAGDIGNAPDGTQVRFVRVLAPKVDNPAARLVALQFGRRTPVVRSRKDLGPGIAVVVGDRFVDMTTKAPRLIKAGAAGSGC